MLRWGAGLGYLALGPLVGAIEAEVGEGLGGSVGCRCPRAILLCSPRWVGIALGAPGRDELKAQEVGTSGPGAGLSGWLFLKGKDLATRGEAAAVFRREGGERRERNRPEGGLRPVRCSQMGG